MKLSLSAAAAGLLALGLAPAHAQGGGVPASGVTIYGVADAGIEWSSNSAGSSRRLVSGGALGSRLGFRGVEDLGGGVSAVFRLEQGINLDDGTLGQGGARSAGRPPSAWRALPGAQ
ncbi:porin [Acidovorax carolinensis]|uniref:porin n=1 Tax=Acidovorax carolinensis TaxID=553814 RepID=UPI00202B399C|nr:porin [Acidovorax carolinensis]